MNSRQQQAKILRTFRKIHRITGALLFVFFFIIAITGTILGWKKNSNGYLLPNSKIGSTSNLEQWKSMSNLYNNACFILHDSISPNLSIELDRIDVRKEKGIVKFIFEDHLWEIQLDGATGELLQVQKRHSDFIENLHDGSVLDTWFNTSKNQFKLIYTTIMGVALFVFTITGFWLWYGPKKLKRSRKNGKNH